MSTVPIRVHVAEDAVLVLDAAEVADSRWIPAAPSDVLSKTRQEFEKAVAAAVSLYGVVRGQFDTSNIDYGSGQMELGLTLTTEGDLKLVKFKGEGALNITIQWKAKPSV